jgi:hypothetical protein
MSSNKGQNHITEKGLKMRNAMTYLIYPVLRITGFRFGKAYRYGETFKHRAVYFLVDTVKANIIAG